MIDYEKLINHLKQRLKFYEIILKNGVIPGEVDSIELQQITGKIYELQHILYYLGEIPIGGFNHD